MTRGQLINRRVQLPPSFVPRRLQKETKKEKEEEEDKRATKPRAFRPLGHSRRARWIPIRNQLVANSDLFVLHTYIATQ